MEAARITERAELAESYRAVAHVCTRAAKAARRVGDVQCYLAQRETVTRCLIRAHQIERAAP